MASSLRVSRPRASPAPIRSTPPRTTGPFLTSEEPGSRALPRRARLLPRALGAARLRRVPGHRLELARFSPALLRARRRVPHARDAEPHRFSLLFGTTWIVNALAFFAILVSVLAAIGVNAVVRPAAGPPLRGLARGARGRLPRAARVVAPRPAVARYTLASLVAFAPIFFANLVFTDSFRDTKTADMAFASNLLGAACGERSSTSRSSRAIGPCSSISSRSPTPSRSCSPARSGFSPTASSSEGYFFARRASSARAIRVPSNVFFCFVSRQASRSAFPPAASPRTTFLDPV